MIRRYRPSDEDHVIGVFLASTIPGQDFLPEEFWQAEAEVVRNELMPVAETWVVDEDGELVAFTALLGDIIGGLFTHPDHQRRGHGRALVEHVLRLHDPIWVEVFCDNARAIGFCERLGFVEEQSSFHVATGLEAMIMRLATEKSTWSHLG